MIGVWLNKERPRFWSFALIFSLALNVVWGIALLRKSPTTPPTDATATVTNVVDGDTFDTKDGLAEKLRG